MQVNDASSCTPDSCRSAYPSTCPAANENGVVSSYYAASTSGKSILFLDLLDWMGAGRYPVRAQICTTTNFKVCAFADASAASTNSGTSGGKSGSCFPASATVHTPHGARTMDRLRVGDQVGYKQDVIGVRVCL